MEQTEALSALGQYVGAMGLTASAFYVGINILMTLSLAFLVTNMRERTGIMTGDGGNEDLKKAIRAHGNNIEYVPLVLVAIITMDMLGMADVWVHAIGSAFVFSRALHAIGIYETLDRSPLRFVGAVGTYAVLLASGLIILLQAYI